MNTMSRITAHRGVVSLLAVLLAVTSVLATAAPAQAAQGTVTVTATVNAAITISLSKSSAPFGTTLEPGGTDSNSGDTVVDFQSSSSNQGSYYVWKADGSGMTVTVQSNKTWNGTIAASENSGTSSSMTIASGVLRYASTAPTSYAEAAAETAFTTSAAAWQTNHAKGRSAHTFFYSLRVDWDDDPGTFASTVTYQVSQ